MGKKSRQKRLRKQKNEQVPSKLHTKIEGPLDLLVRNSPDDKPSFWKRGWTLFWTGATTVSTVFGVVTGLLYFSPSVSVEASSDSFSKDYPLESVFILANQGNLSLKKVRVYCRLNHVVRRDGIEMAWGDSNVSVAQISSLSSKDRTSFKCNNAIGIPAKIVSADITFFISYKSASWMFIQTTPFRFRTMQRNGKLIWLPEYTPENTPFSDSPKWLEPN